MAFTMEDVVNGVLAQLRFATGRDVQIHLQEGIKQDANILYRTLMLKYLWRDFITLTPFTTNATTGSPVEDLSALVSRFTDIATVYPSNAVAELPFISTLTNPSVIRTPTVIPVGTAKVFSIYPVGATASYYLWSRNIQDADYELDDEVPFYKDLLVLGTAHLLCLKSGVNMELAQALKAQFEALVLTYRMEEVKSSYSSIGYHGGIPTDWFVQ